MADPDPLTPPPFALAPLSAANLDAAVRLHRASLDYSLNSRLGAGHLAYLYSILQQDKSCLVTAAVSAGEVLGVVSAVLDPEQFKRKVFASLSFRRGAALALRLLFVPGIWLEWLRGRTLEQPVIYRGAPVGPCLTAIAVAPSARRFGVGRALVAAVDDFVRGNGYSSYHLDTRLENAAARLFYHRLKFIELEQRGRDIILVRDLQT